MKPLKGEEEVVVETKRRGKDPIQVKTITTTADLFTAYLHNKILEATKEGKTIKVTTMGGV